MEADQIQKAYLKRLKSIRPHLSKSMLELASLDLHDVLIEAIVWTPAKKHLKIDLVMCPSQPAKPSSVILQYHGAMLGEQRVDSLRYVGTHRQIELLYHEIDIDDDAALVRRMIFSPREEVTIDFETLNLEVMQRPDERVRLLPGFHEVKD